MHLPFARIGKWPMANAFAIRFSEWQGLWRMRRIRQGECKEEKKKVL